MLTFHSMPVTNHTPHTSCLPPLRSYIGWFYRNMPQNFSTFNFNFIQFVHVYFFCVLLFGFEFLSSRVLWVSLFIFSCICVKVLAFLSVRVCVYLTHVLGFKANWLILVNAVRAQRTWICIINSPSFCFVVWCWLFQLWVLFFVHVVLIFLSFCLPILKFGFDCDQEYDDFWRPTMVSSTDSQHLR